MTQKMMRFNMIYKIYLNQKYFLPQQSKIDTREVSIFDTYSMNEIYGKPLNMGDYRPSRHGVGFMSPALLFYNNKG